MTSRLGANSLLDIVVFGRACAKHIAENLEKGKPHEKIAEDAGMDSIAELDRVRQSSGPKHTSQIRSDMQKVMQSDAAVFRWATSNLTPVQSCQRCRPYHAPYALEGRSLG